MPLPDGLVAGAPCWVDLTTSDPDRARTFYGALFGWSAEEPAAEFGGYFNFRRDDTRIAGCMANDGSAGIPDAWSVYLAVDDAQAAVHRTVAHGGQVLAPAMSVGDLGTMAVVSDAGNAVVGMWEPGLHRGFAQTGGAGEPAWFEVYARDYARSVDFYREVFGWQTQVMGDSDDFRYTRFTDGADGGYAGIMDGSRFLPDAVPAHWMVYFWVEDTDAAVAQAVALGGSPLGPVDDSPFGRLAELADPTGARFKLVSRG